MSKKAMKAPEAMSDSRIHDEVVRLIAQAKAIADLIQTNTNPGNSLDDSNGNAALAIVDIMDRAQMYLDARGNHAD